MADMKEEEEGRCCETNEVDAEVRTAGYEPPASNEPCPLA
jgi:hypothetical protein